MIVRLRYLWLRWRKRQHHKLLVARIELDLDLLDRKLELRQRELESTQSKLYDMSTDLRLLRDRFAELQQTLARYETEIEGLRSKQQINEDLQIPVLVACIKRLQAIYEADIETQVRRNLSPPNN